ncbi:MAG: murein biosynthesis integral membrane protein MurJ [Acidobacteriota bacterium]
MSRPPGQATGSNNLARSAGAMSLVTLLSRVFGYIRDLLQAALLGAADSADAYVIALRIPNLLRRLLGEGALTAAFVPVFTESFRQEGEEESWRFAAAAFWTLGALLLVITGIGVLAAPALVRLLAYGFTGIEGKIPLTIRLTRIMFPYLLFIGLAALAMAILNSLRRFAVPAFTPVLLNLSIITFALVFARGSAHPAFWFAIGVVTGGSLQILFQIPFILRLARCFPFRVTLSDPRVRRVGRLMLPGLFGVGVTQLNLVVDSQVASFLGTGSVSYLYYAVRVEELTLGVFVISLSTVILPALSGYAAAGRDDLLRRALGRGVRLVVFVTLPAMVGLWCLREPIISTLFLRGHFTLADTKFTAWALGLYGAGLLGNGLVKVLAPAYYARFDTATPVKIGAVAFALHVPMCIGLAAAMGPGGIALSTSIAAAVNAGALLVGLARREGTAWLEPARGALLRALVAAAGMGVFLLAVVSSLGFDLEAATAVRAGRLALFVAGGVAVYLVLSWMVGSRELRQIWSGLKGRLEGGDPASL